MESRAADVAADNARVQAQIEALNGLFAATLDVDDGVVFSRSRRWAWTRYSAARRSTTSSLRRRTLELIDGSNLLYLLAEHAQVKARIDTTDLD